MEVDKANMEDGILKVNLKRNVPEEEKPKQIKIG
jgi:HSP20 family molecular chaperone IbpA